MQVDPIPPGQATGDVRRIYDADLEDEGSISNTLLYSLNPAAYEARYALVDAIRVHSTLVATS